MKFFITLLLCISLSTMPGHGIVIVVGQPVGSGASYLIQTDCEETGVPTGWTGGGGWDSTATPIHGAQYVVWSGGERADFTSQAEAWFFLAFRQATNGPSFQLRNTATILLKFNRIGGGNFRAYNADGTELGTTTTTLGTGIKYLWIRAKKGTGANGELDVFISTTTTKPGTTEIASVTCKFTDNVNRFYISDEGFGITRDADDILVDDANIGSNPWNR